MLFLKTKKSMLHTKGNKAENKSPLNEAGKLALFIEQVFNDRINTKKRLNAN